MTGHIFINGEIGRDTTPKTVRDSLNLSYEDYEVHFNSFGGDVYDGYEIGGILNQLRAQGKKVIGRIESQCCSIATYIACCTDTLIMNPHGDFTIHDPTATINGGAKDFIQGAERLARIKAEIIDRYMSKVSRKGITAEQLSKAMEDETSMGPDMAAEWGFVDEIKERMKAVAKIDFKKFNMENKEQKTMFENISNQVSSIFKALRKLGAKNMVEETLEDNTVIIVMAEPEEDWTGKPVTTVDGAPLQPGDYKTASGKSFKVAEAGVIAETVKAAPTDNKDVENTDALKNKIAELEAQIQTSQTQATQKEAEVAKLSAQFSNVIKELEEAKKIVGHDGPPSQGVKFPDLDRHDPMGDAIMQELKARRGA